MQLTKTALGQVAFKERSAQLSPRQRTAFILIDGRKTVAQVLASTSGMGVSQSDIDQMLELGFVVPAHNEDTVFSQPGDLGELGDLTAPDALTDLGDLTEPDALTEVGPQLSKQERYLQAKILATQLTAGMGLRGFRLNMAVESAAGFDELQALLPKLQAALGVAACKPFEAALQG